MTNGNDVLKGKKVLIVDDSKGQREAASSLYRDLGCQVVGEAEDGVETLVKIEELKPDIVSLDIIMPNMDGIECFNKIQKDYPEIKVLFLSCLAKNSEVRDILTKKISSDILLSKPCEKDVLQKALLNLYGVKQEVEPVEISQSEAKVKSDAEGANPSN